ncbi:DNA-binding response regulator [Nocardia mangyaensis]|uniref:DNA-binding response regulator n=1 Tax=Nocardia mangyaensis TaxID=2213200 RepID=A0A1J0VRW1_9NOCA|nr:response regulator transcription factor [Nocardia mangyaensis]APE34772.1 DNA-binding response regulator [Nocardia mangyaensis]
MTPADAGREHCVLVVDDDRNVRESLQRGLELSGFAVLTAGDGAQAIRSCTEHDPDVIVLDMQMPRLSGLGVITALRAAGNDVPICVLSAHSAPDDRIMGLQAGADDYLVKPFVFDELTARLHALLRRYRTTRPEPARAEPLTLGSLRIDAAGRRVRRAGRELDLTRREYELLTVLAAHHDVVQSRERLLATVWGYTFDTDTNVVDVFVSYLRRKLEAAGEPRIIHTVRGVGYVLRAD